MNNFTDAWHFPRTELAKQVLGMFDSGLASSLTFFAPRRMGKTEFLRKDIMPLAEHNGWRVFYFSFLDAGAHSEQQFIDALTSFAQKDGFISKASNLLKSIGKVSGEVAGVKGEFELGTQQTNNSILTAIERLAQQQSPVLLLLDEIQALAGNAHKSTIASLRTALDTDKDRIKVIFTGSSREGLRKMFSASNAPFFHYGQNLHFPELSRGFTDHLAENYQRTTGRSLDQEELWAAFVDMHRSPQLARSLVERLALNPQFSIEFAKQQFVLDIASSRDFHGLWDSLKPVEHFLLIAIAQDQPELYSSTFRQQLANRIGVNEIPVSTVQSALRSLTRRQVIFKPDNSIYEIEDSLLKEWILDEK